MNEREAQEIIRRVESNWRFDLGSARSLWRAALAPHTAEQATKAVARLAASTKRIDLADVLDVLRMTKPKQESVGEKNEKRSTEVPEYVFVWGWSRFHRKPPDERDFPQHHTYGVIPDGTMTMIDYAELRDEWIAAGAPREVFRAPTLKEI